MLKRRKPLLKKLFRIRLLNLKPPKRANPPNLKKIRKPKNRQKMSKQRNKPKLRRLMSRNLSLRKDTKKRRSQKSRHPSPLPSKK